MSFNCRLDKWTVNRRTYAKERKIYGSYNISWVEEEEEAVFVPLKFLVIIIIMVVVVLDDEEHCLKDGGRGIRQ